ncbi:MAG: hypothetical protein IKJ65_11670 [Clostridia bacterium]|nr:hypothetical protein [Clostridia bacterium]
MKSMKRIIAAFLLFILSFSLAACKDDSEQSVLGVWNVNEDGILQMTGLTKEEFDNFKEMGVEQTVTMDFGKDGIVVIIMSVAGQYVKTQHAYKVKDGKLLIDSDPADFVINENVMTITQDDIKFSLTKISK